MIKKQHILSLIVTWLVLINPALAQVVVEFGEPVPATPLEQLNASQIPLIENILPDNITKDTEVILVSGYEPSGKLGVGSIVKVIVDRPRSNVLLVLTSYDTVTWQVEATQHTRISAILVGGYKKSQLVSKLNINAYRVSLPYSYKKNNKNFVAALSKLYQWFGIDKVDVFRGSYKLPAELRITNLDPVSEELTLQGHAVQRSKQITQFNLLDSDYNIIQFTQDGSYNNSSPITNAVMLDIDNIYRIADNGIERFSKASNKVVKIPLAPDFPPFSWPSGIAWDSKRNIISVVSFGGEGYLYRYDVANNKWLDVRSLNNEDIHYLTYDAEADRYVGWQSFSKELIFISPEGNFLFKKKLDVNKLANFNRVIDSGNGPSSNLIIVAKRNHLILLQLSGSFHHSGKVLNIWDYDINTQRATLTYKINQSLLNK